MQYLQLDRVDTWSEACGRGVEGLAHRAPGGRAATVGLAGLGAAGGVAIALASHAPWWVSLLVAAAGGGIGYAIGDRVDSSA